MSSLKDICYEQIKDNYWYGLFGDFKLVIDIETGYFNATKLCKEGGREFRKWHQTLESKRLIEYLNNQVQKLMFSAGRKRPAEKSNLIYEIRGGTAEKDNVNGTYVHEDLITSIACWISAEFAVKVNKIVKNYYTNKFVKEYKNDNKKLQKKIIKVESKLENLRLKNEKYKDDVAPETSIASKLNMLSIIKKNKTNSDYDYYIIRCQRGLYKKSLSDLKIRYPSLIIEHEISYNPNAINLFNRLKENLSYIETKFNHLRFKKHNLQKFITDIEKFIPKLE